MRTMLTAGLAAGLIAAATTVVAVAPAQASCFYNQSNINEVRVYLKCGFSCGMTWTIKKGDYNCKAGEGGLFEVLAGGQASFLTTGNVDDHGYVTIEGSCERGVSIKSWRADHTLRSQYKAGGRGESCN